MQVTAILSLAAASSSAGVTVLYSKDLDYCNSPPYLACEKFQVSVTLAFISWFLLAVSSIVMFWLLGAVWTITCTSFTNRYITTHSNIDMEYFSIFCLKSLFYFVWTGACEWYWMFMCDKQEKILKLCDKITGGLTPSAVLRKRPLRRWMFTYF